MKKKEKRIVNNKTQKNKISFFGGLLIVIGSSIGAGIFFKSSTILENSLNSLILSIFCWIIATFAIIAMALALIEVAAAKKDNLSIVGWVKTFNKENTFEACKNFMLYIYMPLSFFFMPLYVIMSLQDGISALINKPFVIGTNCDWLIWTLISIAISLYFIFSAGLSARIANIHNKIVTYIKFIPLVLVTLLGFMLVSYNHGSEINIGIQIQGSIEKGTAIELLIPGIGIFLSVSAIFFAYDGFFVVAGIQSEMKEPKKTPKAILIGLIITTILYLSIAISMTINGGSFFKMQDMMIKYWGDSGRILFGIINILIAIGVLGIINGYAMWTPRFIEQLIKEGDLPFSFKLKNKLNEKCPKVGAIYSIVIFLPIIIIFTFLGALTYISNESYANLYGSGMGSLYSFADLMGTWTSTFSFGFIVAAIFGCWKSKKENSKLKNINQNNDKKYFKPMAIISFVLVFIPIFVTSIIPFVNFIALFFANKNIINNYQELFISRLMTIITLILFIIFTYIPIWIENKIRIKKFGSIKNYKIWKNSIFNIEN